MSHTGRLVQTYALRLVLLDESVHYKNRDKGESVHLEKKR